MYIYKTVNKFNNMIYVGLSTKSPENSEKYLGSGIRLKHAIKKYGNENFYKEILEIDGMKKIARRNSRHFLIVLFC